MAYQRIAYIIFTFALLTGCASKQHTPTRVSSSDPASVQLAEAATSVSQSLYQLAAVEKAATPRKSEKLPDPNSYGMGNLVSVDWTGPVAAILRKIANVSHYKLRTLGTEPSIPIVVSVKRENEPIGDILRDVAYQAHQRAQVILYPQQRVIELRYVKS
jgi:defect-in-organelle-trafficking protein DotD